MFSPPVADRRRGKEASKKMEKERQKEKSDEVKVTEKEIEIEKSKKGKDKDVDYLDENNKSGKFGKKRWRIMHDDDDNDDVVDNDVMEEGSGEKERVRKIEADKEKEQRLEEKHGMVGPIGGGSIVSISSSHDGTARQYFIPKYVQQLLAAKASLLNTPLLIPSQTPLPLPFFSPCLCHVSNRVFVNTVNA
jgi:hypothetical protein